MSFILSKEKIVPVGEKLRNNPIGVVYSSETYGAGETKLSMFSDDQKKQLDQICKSILNNLSANPERIYRISLEGRGQASGEADERNIKLASFRAKYMRDMAYKYILKYEQNGVTIASQVLSGQLTLRIIDNKPFYDVVKGRILWADGQAGDRQYQRSKVNVYYESKLKN
ncbi:hypothetical protein [Flammeovirga pacifica]|uniref:OmpA-like domain-containing protein n=1 Tax=Flammeovirga pacifica TaxID=915059 RepID=A0A1S1Z4V3_FLAPC|nr:hypothetical protein [Flammeovirga pacifica]OHX68316.1 hypothetical protein NH26_19170 [Flammeovirga pacifica]